MLTVSFGPLTPQRSHRFCYARRPAPRLLSKVLLSPDGTEKQLLSVYTTSDRPIVVKILSCPDKISRAAPPVYAVVTIQS